MHSGAALVSSTPFCLDQPAVFEFSGVKEAAVTEGSGLVGSGFKPAKPLINSGGPDGTVDKLSISKPMLSDNSQFELVELDMSSEAPTRSLS